VVRQPLHYCRGSLGVSRKGAFGYNCQTKVIAVRTLALFAIACLAVFGAVAPAGLTIAITVADTQSRPVPGVRVSLYSKQSEAALATITTDVKGQASFSDLVDRPYSIAIQHDGFEPLRREVDLTLGQSAAVAVTLVPAMARKESIEVSAQADPVDSGSAPPVVLDGKTVKELPGRPANVADALPMVPGVVREPGGALVISASPEHRSALIVNSADVTDPATGQFGLTVPIDSVEALNVFQAPYLAEYGRFTAGLVTVETRRGGDQWKWELNDPLPEFRIRSHHLRGLRTATPRLNFEGPLLAHKLYISEGFEYEIRKTAVYTLPFPRNQKLEQGLNSFTQIDWIVSERHLVTGTTHIAPQRLGHVNMDYYNPEATTPDASTHNYTGTVTDRLTLFGGLLESTFSVTQFDAGVWARGTSGLTLTPTGNFGYYFAQQTREADRYSGRSTYAFAPVRRWGLHSFKLGVYAAASNEDGQVANFPVDIQNALGQRIERISFPRVPLPFDIDDRETTVFGQDHWILTPRLSVDLGIRTESQQVSGAFRVAPRVGLAWSPFGTGFVVRGGFGLFYDRVPLNIYTFNRYPDQTITTYQPDGQIASGPYLYLNTLGQSRVRFPFVNQKPVDGNFSPHSGNWSLSVEQPVAKVVRLRTSYMQHDSTGLAILTRVAPDPMTGTGAVLLEGTGKARYRQLEFTARARLATERELFFSYTYTRARGDLNDFSTYLSTFPAPVIRPNLFGNLPASLPHRFLAWGIFKVTKTVRVAPVIEWRNGFPYNVIDAYRNYADTPLKNRYPTFLSLDARFSKDIQVNPKYAVRLSLSSFNLTNHFNPEAVHNNINDPVFGYFFGHRGRRFTADFDVLF
jgi:hypothetical protein